MKNPILLFDGVCNLCSGLIRFILTRERDTDIQFVSLQSEKARTIFKEYNIGDHELDSIVFIENGKVFDRSDAVLKVIKHLRNPWRLLSIFIIVPSFIRNEIYSLIAKNRYRIFGKMDNCWIPDQRWHERFLD